MSSKLFTIGHSNHEVEVFINLLRQHGITAIVDVRSHPYSRYVPHFSRDPLKVELAKAGIAYVFLGKELGARSENPACYREGRVRFDCLAQEPQFTQGLERVRQGMERYYIALMCSEKDPLDCHRAILVARRLSINGIPVNHIHADGAVESQHDMESRLLALCELPEGDMFVSREECVAKAYELQGARIAYVDKDMVKSKDAVAV